MRGIPGDILRDIYMCDMTYGRRDIATHRQQYSAERMSLVVLGGQPLDVLQGWVQDHFSAVPAGRGPRPVFSDAGPPFQVYFLLPPCPSVMNLHAN